MHPQPRRELQALLRRYGPGLAADTQRMEALLADLCGEHQREIFVLVHAQRSGILAQLGQMAGQRADSALRRRLAQRLQDRYAFADEAAAWAVDAWADALNVRAVPVYQSWLLGLWHTLRSRVADIRRRPPSQRATDDKSSPRSARVQSNPGRSTFGGIGVQWGKAAARWLWTFLLLLLLTAGALAARQNGWLALARSFVFGQGTATPQVGGQTSAPAAASTALTLRYPPPLEARIEADLLNVRASPALDAAVLGKVGPLGAAVTVDGFTPEGDWSHITDPVAGWISNEFVTFASGIPGQRVYLQPALGQVTEAGVPLRSTPRADAPVTATLVAGQTLVLVARSADGLWRQVVEPWPGWVESRFIALMER
ncbi:MAG: SH3 domain-containing protein [Chloroflexi bacterium]|nr:MAG: SH3 domain-containing protein [Chloroflexota bacterium]